VSEEGEEELQLLHQHVGAAEMEREDVSPETETQRGGGLFNLFSHMTLIVCTTAWIVDNSHILFI